ncbi:N-acetylmuramoyl-L-alanine amidase [uncultured Limosilactobacillus sp.]|uniref:N-acetylmuramoyl-L-alanine amidase n=1 Tax=uncultured Limosilactobacillus sp. TaxID=2837629 RepID=UPI0025DCA956|nr:N-acetylmuramoyl-L-alanine amidase [uncultured Limosilactobacillus sp.]
MQNRLTFFQKYHHRLPGWIISLVAVFIALGIVISLTNPSLGQQTVQINPKTMTVRQGPGMNYQSINLSHSTSGQVIKTTNGWKQVQLSSAKQVWIAGWLLQAQNLPQKTNLTGATIVIDPGHGGNDTGATYVTNSQNPAYFEKTYTFQLAKKVAQALRRQGARVYLTRNKDEYVSLGARTRLAERVHADLFISFHFDSSPSENEASGFTTYYYHRKNHSRAIAQAINKAFNNLPLTNRGVDFGDFYVLRDNKQPAVLLEMGYINSSKDYQQIKSANYQQKIVTDLILGLKNYFE